MGSRIDARRGIQADMAKRETRMLPVVAGMIGLAVAIPGILIAPPARVGSEGCVGRQPVARTAIPWF
ncbi:MAG: hypothetical protein OXC91_13285 [Rhodobacteraceae bacterium]|nr:hypothetical protein [Paracoccaceae bacterium]